MSKSKLWMWVRKEIVLVIALSLAMVSSLITGVHTSHIDLNVLMLLFSLMCVIGVYKSENVLLKLSNMMISTCQNSRQLMLVLMLLTFFGSMIITNDVALITFIPLSLILIKSIQINPIKLIVFLTIAANLGSSVTPIGNPQNLYLYSYFELTFLQFIKMVLPLGLMSLLIIGSLLMRERSVVIDQKKEAILLGNKLSIGIYSVILGLILLSVFHIISVVWVFFISLVITILINRPLLKQIDYSLLLTFIGFFVFIGNISSITAVSQMMQWLLQTKEQAYLSSIVASQIISNVPAAILLSTFTPHVAALLLGVNIGGLGTLIASLASVISYKLFVSDYPELSGKYLKVFTIYNVILLLFLSIVGFMFI